jgi:sugar lactone lactonase YvrE
MPQRVGWVLPERGRDTVLLGLQEGFARARLEDEVALEWVARPFSDRASLRLNDAKADSTGAVWAGSLNNDDESRPDGCLYRLGPDGSLAVVDTGYTVANGPAISPNESLMLHTDSGRRTIYAFDLDVARGALSNKRVWKQFQPEEGYPDGMTFDAEGCVWVAHWGAGCVSRFDPAGELLSRIRFDASHITNVCFGGDRFHRLFVSSARAGLSDQRLKQESEHAGALFEAHFHGVVGLPGHPFSGAAPTRELP